MKINELLKSNIQVTVTEVTEEKRNMIIVSRALNKYYENNLENDKNIGSNRKSFLIDNNIRYAYKSTELCNVRFGSRAGYDSLYYVNYDDALKFLIDKDV